MYNYIVWIYCAAIQRKHRNMLHTLNKTNKICTVNTGSDRRHYKISCLPTFNWKTEALTFCAAEVKWHDNSSPSQVTCLLASRVPLRRHIMCTAFIFLSRWLSVRQHSGLKNGQVSRHCCVSVTGNIPEHICFPFSTVSSTRYATSTFSEISTPIKICLNETLWRQLNTMHLWIL